MTSAKAVAVADVLRSVRGVSSAYAMRIGSKEDCEVRVFHAEQNAKKLDALCATWREAFGVKRASWAAINDAPILLG